MEIPKAFLPRELGLSEVEGDLLGVPREASRFLRCHYGASQLASLS